MDGGLHEDQDGSCGGVGFSAAVSGLPVNGAVFRAGDGKPPAFMTAAREERGCVPGWFGERMLETGFRKGEGGDLEEKIIEMMESLKDRMTEGILEMVRIDSVESEAEPDAPFGPGVKRALLKALKLGERLGFRCVNLDNYIGYVEYGVRIMSAPWDMWTWCLWGTGGDSRLSADIWLMGLSTAGGFWTTRGLCCPVFTGSMP